MPLSILQNCKQLDGLAHVKNIILVASGKGGVGKSTVAIHLAAACAHLKKKAGLLDADLYGPSLRRMLREDSPPKEIEGKLCPAYSRSGIALMTFAYFRNMESSNAFRAPIANKLISSFLSDVNWGSLDYLFVDCPPGTGDIVLTLLQLLPMARGIIVTMPNEISLADATKSLELLKLTGNPILGVIENMSCLTLKEPKVSIPIFGEGGGRRLANAHGVPFLGEVPIDPSLAKAGDKGVPLVEEWPDSTSASIFLEIAKKVFT